jgi:hypothetical protein
MKLVFISVAACAFVGAGLGSGAAMAAAARPSAAPPPAHVVKLLNAEPMAVTAVYASPTGKSDWGDDLLGSQTAAPGKTVTLGFKDMPAELCKQDLQLLMNDGKTVTKADIDVCTTTDYRFSR